MPAKLLAAATNMYSNAAGCTGCRCCLTCASGSGVMLESDPFWPSSVGAPARDTSLLELPENSASTLPRYLFGERNKP